MNAICVFDPSSSFNQQKIQGTISFSQSSPLSHTFVEIKLKNFPKNGRFGCHVHEYGDLTEGCKTACSHFNPHKRQHGSRELYGVNRHVGDLAIPHGNLISNDKGEVIVSFYDELISLYSTSQSIIGRMIVIHAQPDDGGRFRNENTPQGIESGITGNAGKRTACAIIGLSKSTQNK